MQMHLDIKPVQGRVSDGFLHEEVQVWSDRALLEFQRVSALFFYPLKFQR